MKMLIIRHGLTEANERRLYCGSSDLPLSKKGIEALENEHFPDFFQGEDFCAVTSGALRCRMTAELLFGISHARADKRFAEMDFGIFEMHSYEELSETPEYHRWISGDNEKNLCPGGESGEQMKKRVVEALDELIAKDENVLLVSHGGPIAVIIRRLFPDAGENRYECQPACGRGFFIELERGKKSFKRI